MVLSLKKKFQAASGISSSLLDYQATYNKHHTITKQKTKVVYALRKPLYIERERKF